MAQIDKIAKDIKDIGNIATSYIGGMLFPANGTDHPLLMAYHLKWGLHLSDGESLDTTEEVINYLLRKISNSDNEIAKLNETIVNLDNRIANLEDQTEYTITVSSSSKAKCDLTKIKKSGGIVTITPNSGYKIKGVQPTNCSITHIDNSNKYNISNVTGNIILDVLTQEVDIQIEQLLNGNVLTINRPVNNSNVIKIVSQTGGSINPKSILVNGTSSIIEPEKITVEYENLEGNKVLTFKGSDINAKPTITKVNKLEYSNLTASGVTLSTNGYAETGTLTITFNDVNGLYNKVFNVEVSITTDNALKDVFSGWKYESNKPAVAIINGLTITGRSVGTSRITILYSGKYIQLGDVDLTVNAESKTYYWYVGQDNPANMTSISPIVTENAVTGWRETGSSLTATYEYNSTDYPISSNPSQNSMWYYALPENTGLGAFDAQNENYAVNPISSVTINDVKYNIYEGGASRKFNALTIKNK